MSKYCDVESPYVLSIWWFGGPHSFLKELVCYYCAEASCMKFLPWCNYNLHYVCPCFR